jgi:hypothetical protein
MHDCLMLSGICQLVLIFVVMSAITTLHAAVSSDLHRALGTTTIMPAWVKAFKACLTHDPAAFIPYMLLHSHAKVL